MIMNIYIRSLTLCLASVVVVPALQAADTDALSTDNLAAWQARHEQAISKGKSKITNWQMLSDEAKQAKKTSLRERMQAARAGLAGKRNR